ncbi:uncharacterized protein EV420DRAFT_1649571 [Desarmillaria tabescens]|uniref:Uncharacterized protein n=1 Tax=Armillaria tabescens TaxID=1929756 RepID=A0AA39MQM6_ARMTA|nr:uncharacterized protein EV420DRAFT_1649571 [Desarmillaria tabescens]KAK0442683.1 hypothetical protein EV420DRAFT_1649571 [Desarmillaria tabescens]
MSPQYSVYLLDASFSRSATLDIVPFRQCQHHQLQQRILAWSSAQLPQLVIRHKERRQSYLQQRVSQALEHPLKILASFFSAMEICLNASRSQTISSVLAARNTRILLFILCRSTRPLPLDQQHRQSYQPVDPALWPNLYQSFRTSFSSILGEDADDSKEAISPPSPPAVDPFIDALIDFLHPRTVQRPDYVHLATKLLAFQDVERVNLKSSSWTMYRKDWLSGVTDMEAYGKGAEGVLQEAWMSHQFVAGRARVLRYTNRSSSANARMVAHRRADRVRVPNFEILASSFLLLKILRWEPSRSLDEKNTATEESQLAPPDPDPVFVVVTAQ